MIKEEAGQIVLEGKPWVPCEVCGGRGKARDPFVTPMGRTVYDGHTIDGCWYCGSTGYKLPEIHRIAYEVAGVPIPEKPLTPKEQLIKSIGESMSDALQRQSILRQAMLPLQLIPDESLEGHKKGKL